MVNKIVKKYSKDHIIIIGKQIRNFISTPNLTLKRKLQETFKVYNIDEFRTSCLLYKTEEVCENLYLKFKKDKLQKERKMHSILTYQMENNRKGCINRDKNVIWKQEKDLKSIEENTIIKVLKPQTLSN